MKVQIFLAACLVAAAFAAPIDNFVDPDCIEEDLVVEEPSQEIDADFALGLPDLRLDFGNNAPEEDCVDEAVSEEPEIADAVTDECEDPIETTPEPQAAITEAECEDPITAPNAPEPTTAEECVEEISTEPAPEPEVADAVTDECADDQGNAEQAPEISIRIEPAAVVDDIKVYGEEAVIPDLEECEE